MYKVVITESFKSQLRKLVKKNRSLKEVLKIALTSFDKTCAVSIGRGVYKTRLHGEGKGKSGGYRLLVLIVEINNILAPIAIYAKNEKENLTLNEITEHLEKVKEELLCTNYLN